MQVLSYHLYQTVLANKVHSIGEYVHIKFGEPETLIKEVEEGTLMLAVVPHIVKTFDTVCYPLYKQKLILTCTPDNDIEAFEKLYENDKRQAER